MFEVQNQPPPLEDYDYSTGAVLREAVRREGADWGQSRLTNLGGELGMPETIALGFAANRYPPQLKAFDRFGHRLDEVEFHPAWHALMTLGVEGRAAFEPPWADPKPGAHVARAAGFYMLGQIESGVLCPLAMTYGSVPTLRQTAPSPRNGCRASSRITTIRISARRARRPRRSSAWA